jgi:hypothetical protein
VPRPLQARSSLGWLLLALTLTACQSSGSSGAPSASAGSPTSLPSPSATALPLSLPRPTDIPTDGTCEEGHVCLGLLAAGTTYHTEAFEPTITVTPPADGWENLSDEGAVFMLLSIDAPGDAIAFFRGAKAVKPDGTTASADDTVEGLSSWLASNDLLDVTTATPVTVGGLQGVAMDIKIAADAVNHPADCPVQTCIPIFKGEDSSAKPPWHWDWGSVDGETQRLYLLNAADGVVAIFVDSYDGLTFDALTTAADGILAGLRFG